MRLTRVFVDLELSGGMLIELPPDTAAHLAKVLRARSGDSLVLFSGNGLEYAGTVETVRGSRVSASVGQGRPVDRESPLAVTLVQCVPRGDRMDFIVQKATELGVARIVPVLSERSVVRLGGAQAESKSAHWRGVVVNACEQCGRNRLPLVENPRPLLDYLGGLTTTPKSPITRLVLEPALDAEATPAPLAQAAEIAIGPEGGFTEDELTAFRLAGFHRLRLGPRILRTETAALAALTWLQSCHGDMVP
jgi:16S rRNA (uracil1498-N3)-methyltransferase